MESGVWQRVISFEESGKNYFGRILLPKDRGQDGEAGDEKIGGLELTGTGV